MSCSDDQTNGNDALDSLDDASQGQRRSAASSACSSIAATPPTST